MIEYTKKLKEKELMKTRSIIYQLRKNYVHIYKPVIAKNKNFFRNNATGPESGYCGEDVS